MADATAFQPAAAGAGRALVTAELLAIGTELTVGETTDTNSGELARSLVALGVTVVRISNLPGRPRDGRRRAACGARARGPGRDDRGPRADPRRPHPRGRRGGCAARRPVVDPATLGWLRGAVGAPAPAVPGDQHEAGVDASRRRGCWRTRTERRPAGGSTGPTAGSSSRCPARRARCGRCGQTRSCRGWRPGASASRRRSGRSGSPASASRRWPSAWASRCCVRRTRSSRPTRARRRWTSASRPAPRTGAPPRPRRCRRGRGGRGAR